MCEVGFFTYHQESPSPQDPAEVALHDHIAVMILTSGEARM
jgi:hypothetical protein